MPRTNLHPINKYDRCFALLVAFYFFYALLFIGNTSFKVDGQKYFCLLDDSMISMTYAKNLADGHGLVYNQGGERVEGYSNLLWVLYMALAHFVISNAAHISIFIQISEMVLIGLSLHFVRLIARKISNSEIASLAAVFLTAFYYPINNWALQGMDVGPVMFVICFAVYEALKSMEKGYVRIPMFLILGIGTLLRIDFFIFFLIIPIYLIIIQKKQRKKLSLYLAFSIFIFLGGQTVFRLIYYGEWLPNTYFLKVSGVPLIVKVLMGVTSTAGLIGDITIPVFLLPFAYFLIKKKFHSVQLVFVIILAQMFYNIYVGGDAWDYYGGANRYWAVIMPLFFIALSSAVLYLLNIAELRLKKVGFADGSLYTGIYIAIIVGIFIGVHSSSYRGHINELLLKRPALQYDEHEYSVAMSRFLGDITTKDARIAGAQAGTVKYFTGRYFIDILGKTDKHIARQRPRMGLSIDDYEKFRPGHNKYDIDYSIKTFHPDVIMGLWGDTASLASYLNNSYQYLGQVRFGELRLRKNSTNILWNEFDFSNTDLIRRYFNIPTTDYNFYKNR